MYTFSHSPEPIRHLQPNPSDKPEIVAVLRGDVSMGTMIEMLNVAAGTVVSAWSGRSAQEAQLCSKIISVTMISPLRLRTISFSGLVAQRETTNSWRCHRGSHPIYTRGCPEECYKRSPRSPGLARDLCCLVREYCVLRYVCLSWSVARRAGVLLLRHTNR